MDKAIRIARVVLSIPAFFAAAALTNLILGLIFSWWRQGTTLDNLDEHLSGNFIQSLVLHGVGLLALLFVYPNERKKPIFIAVLIFEIILVALLFIFLSQIWARLEPELKAPALSKWNLITGFAGAIVSYFFIWKSFVNDRNSIQ